MNAQVLKTAFDGALLWGCGLGLVGVALALCARGFARVPVRVCAAVRRYGLSAVLAFGGFAAVATVSAQKPGNVTTDSHGLTRIEGEKPTALNTEETEGGRLGEENDVLDRIDKIDRIDGVGAGSPNPVNPVNPVEETPCLPTSITSALSAAGTSTLGYTLSRVGTNEVFSFDPPEGAVIAENWRRRGAATDWRRLSFDGWEFPFGGSAFSSLVAFADGTVLLSTNAALRPVTASLGLVPEANWPRIFTNLHESVTIRDNPWTNAVGSLFWHCLTPSNTLVLTWRDARLHRSPTNPVSLQVELNPNGNFTYRYDFSVLASDDLLTNVMAGVEGDVGEGRGKKEEGRSADVQTSSLLLLTSYFPSPRDITSLTFRSDSERLCDEARDDFEEALGDLDPFACPPGSTNTLWEHLAYTGTTNGVFAYPQSTERTAVLRVSVSGAGRGELLVGGRAVPLVGQGTESTDFTDSHGLGEDVSATLNAEETEKGRHGEAANKSVGKVVEAGASISPNPVNPVNPVRKTPCLPSSSISALSDSNPPATPSLLLPVPRGQTVPLHLRASGTLAVSFSSADFAFGRLPDLAAHRLTGRINFPNVSATTPCFHDYRARQREVTLPVGADADALTCTWAASGSVTVENVPPRSALLTGRFDGRETTPVSYTLAHPDYLFGQKTHSQTARFCPPPPEGDDEEEPSADWHYGSRDEDDDEDEPCWHCVWGLCGEGCGCCGLCRHSGAPETGRPGGASDGEEEPQPGDYEAAVTNWPHLSGVLKIREPPLYTPPIRLEVPGAGAPRCCPCPDHATNWVAVAYQSDRLKVVDESGLDFRRATETVDVRLAGVRPSRSVGDAFVSLATNGAVCLDGAYTVLGVGVRRAGVDLAALDARNDGFGLPVPVATDAAEASALELVTAVGLDGGNVRIGFEGASAPFALWAWHPGSATYRKIASSDGEPLESAALTPLGSGGLDLAELAGRPLTRPVALAFEAAGPVDAWSGPEVVVSLGDAEVYRERLPVSITSVDDLYRYADLRGAEAGGGFAPSVPGDPGNLPDGETDGRHFVFVHGYNVNAAASRLWARAMFKRLWWAGSRSRFTAVDWRGDYSQVGGFAPNYWANVVHALKTAPALADLVNALPGEKVMLAHSLGNVLTSEACKYHALSYSRYFMLNAAVPAEAYVAVAEQEDNMVPKTWQCYPPRFYSANWHGLFASDDGRRLLNWRGRYAGILHAVNCYSPTEDVLENAPCDGAGGAWSMQELLKGTGLALVLPGVKDEGGWGFNRTHTVPLSATELLKTEFSDDELKMSPPFLPFSEDWLLTTNAVSEAQVLGVCARILADGIPATTFAAGANAIGGGFVDVNYHELMSNKESWPEDRMKGGQMRWEHSDIKDLSLPYVHKLFIRIVNGE